MKKSNSLFYPILIFVTAQLAWFILLSLWIYWYITNHLLLSKVGEKLLPSIISGGINLAALISGIVLLLALSFILTILFIHLYRQMNVTRLYDNFIANVTHELKSPLSSLQLYLDTMQKHEVSRHQRMEFIELMRTDIVRLEHLINSILYLSSFEQKRITRKVAHDYQVVDADSIIRDVISEVVEEFKFPNENISIEGNANCRCVVDRGWFKIVIRNLFDNAIKYSLDEAKIKVKLRSDSKYFHIDFSDEGIGISPKDQKKIFGKFQRIYNPNIPNVKGTGLGLYWVKEIVQFHGGKISVHSAGIGSGTTFRIALPIYRASKKRYTRRLLEVSRKYKPKTNNENRTGNSQTS